MYHCSHGSLQACLVYLELILIAQYIFQIPTHLQCKAVSDTTQVSPSLLFFFQALEHDVSLLASAAVINSGQSLRYWQVLALAFLRFPLISTVRQSLTPLRSAFDCPTRWEQLVQNARVICTQSEWCTWQREWCADAWCELVQYVNHANHDVQMHQVSC